jgi:hypothetical protein
MQLMQPWKDCRAMGGHTMALARTPWRGAGLACLAVAVLALGGCSSIATPLPDLGPTGSTSMSKEDQKKAVDELNQKRATHEQDAEKQIEDSR